MSIKKKKKFVFDAVFLFFVQFIVLYIILSLDHHELRTFLKCWKILSGSRDIQKEKKSKNS